MNTPQPTWEQLYCNYRAGRDQIAKMQETYPWQLHHWLQSGIRAWEVAEKIEGKKIPQTTKKFVGKKEWRRKKRQEEADAFISTISKLSDAI